MGGFRRRFKRKELDILSLDIIKKGKNVEYEIKGKKYTLDIKEYEKELRFRKPELFI